MGFLFAGFTVLFTIVVFNILIAILGNMWTELMEKNQMDDNRQKLNMIHEVIEMRVWMKRAFSCNKKLMKKAINTSRDNYYFVFRRKDNAKQTKEGFQDKLSNDFEQINEMMENLQMKFSKIQE